MRKSLYLTAALALVLSVPGAALAQGRGNDDRGDNGRGQEGRDRGGERRGDDDRGRGRDERRADRQVAREVRQERREDRREDREERREVRRENGQEDRRDDRWDDRRDDRRVAVIEDGRVVVLRRDRDRGLIVGCPPGLAKKDNGCLPPGQARQIARARYDRLWDRNDDNFDYQYRDGYLYRLNQQGSLLGYVPVLGGALGLGNQWPQQYAYDPTPAYYQSYFGLNQQQYDYRYADGAIYGVDPKTQAITQVVALLTGQNFNVGQRMPTGYDVYNVPYDYRGQYADTAQQMYRYNDGYVYQVDPKTQLVQAAIQLLT